MHRRSVPLRRVAGIAAIAVLTTLGGLAAAPAGAAQPTAPSAGSIGKPLPPNTFKATGPLPTPGHHGPAFAATPKTGPKDIVPSSDYPSVVAVLTSFRQYGTDYVEYCTGTILSPTRVLTAATCDFDLPQASTLILAGDSEVGPTGNGGFGDTVVSTWTDQDFGDYWQHASRNGQLLPYGDVTVLALATALPADYPPITLSAQGDQSPYTPGTDATMVGYAFDPHGYGYLQATGEPLQPDATCAASGASGFDSTTMVCGGQSTGSHYVCDGDQGDPLLIAGKEAAIVTAGSPDCGYHTPYVVAQKMSSYTAPIQAAAAQPAAHDQDVTGDGHSDLLGRTSDGNLVLYSGSGLAGNWYPGQPGLTDVIPVQLATGFGGYAAADITRDVHWNGTGSTTSVLAVNSTGVLTRWNIDFGAVSGSTQLATGWTGVQRLTAVDNWFGPGQDGLLAVRSDGSLWAYHGTGAGGLSSAPPVQIGSGWGGSTGVLDAGDWLGDGHTDLISRHPDGSLWLFETTNGSGGWVNGGGQQIATGWNFVVNPVAVGDWGGDGLPDLIGLDPQGDLWMSTTDGHGNWTSQPIELTGDITVPLAF